MIGETMVEVRLRGVPIDLWKRASAHQEAIQRELEIIRASEPPDSVPNRLLSLLEQLDARFGGLGEPAWEKLRAAADEGEQASDLTFELPLQAAQAATQLGSMLSEVDEYCRAGDHLMTLATPEELVDFREWFLDEFSRQIEGGEAPLPWQEHRGGVEPSKDHTEQPSPTGHRSETIVFEGSLDLTTVGELRESIQDLRAPDLGEIVVDLTNVGFVDSVGIGLLVTVHMRLEEEGVVLRLIVPPRLKELLRLTGLISLLHPEDSAGV